MSSNSLNSHFQEVDATIKPLGEAFMSNSNTVFIIVSSFYEQACWKDEPNVHFTRQCWDSIPDSCCWIKPGEGA